MPTAERASTTPDDGFVARGAAMRSVEQALHKIARDDAAVLLLAQPGTGRKTVARRIHQHSPRSNRPFVTVDCRNSQSDLLEAELFGREPGAFSGPRKVGRLEAAHQGTVFLQAVDDLPEDLQTRLLRFLEDGTVQRVGGEEAVPVDVRVISASDGDLADAVSAGQFREDLYYRLNVLQLALPLLREREEDIVLLAERFLARFRSEQPGRRVEGFSEAAKRVMNAHDWPGNLRELANRVRRALVMCETRLIQPADLGLERRRTPRDHVPTLAEVRARAEVQAIYAAIRRNRGNIAAAARELEISRVTLYQLMGKYGLEKDRCRSGEPAGRD